MTALPCETPSTGPAAVLASTLSLRIPVLNTERLTLRAPRIEDFDTYAQIACGPRGVFLGCTTRADAWYDFATMVAGWTLRGHGAWTLEPRAGGAPLGFVLIGFEPGDLEPELGFVLTAEGEGQGLAEEAALAARGFAFDTLALPSLVSYIDPANTRSIALAERLGAVRDGEIVSEGETTLVFRHPGPEGAQ